VAAGDLGSHFAMSTKMLGACGTGGKHLFLLSIKIVKKLLQTQLVSVVIVLINLFAAISGLLFLTGFAKANYLRSAALHKETKTLTVTMTNNATGSDTEALYQFLMQGNEGGRFLQNRRADGSESRPYHSPQTEKPESEILQ
jgi:hypothetical protein